MVIKFYLSGLIPALNPEKTAWYTVINIIDYCRDYYGNLRFDRRTFNMLGSWQDKNIMVLPYL